MLLHSGNVPRGERKHTWAWRCGGHVHREPDPAPYFPWAFSLDGSSLLWSQGLLNHGMSTCPWGLICAESHILCGVWWIDKEYGQERESSCPRDRGSCWWDVLKSPGLCWHPVCLCYQLLLSHDRRHGGKCTNVYLICVRCPHVILCCGFFYFYFN